MEAEKSRNCFPFPAHIEDAGSVVTDPGVARRERGSVQGRNLAEVGLAVGQVPDGQLVTGLGSGVESVVIRGERQTGHLLAADLDRSTTSPLWTFHTIASPSSPPAARREPSWLNSSPDTGRCSPRSVATSRPSPARRSCTLVGSTGSAVASSRPPGWRTPSGPPRSPWDHTTRPVCTSYSRKGLVRNRWRPVRSSATPEKGWARKARTSFLVCRSHTRTGPCPPSPRPGRCSHRSTSWLSDSVRSR